MSEYIVLQSMCIEMCVQLHSVILTKVKYVLFITYADRKQI